MNAELLSYFEKLDDPRVDRTTRYPLNEILFLIISATISGCEGWKWSSANGVVLGQEKTAEKGKIALEALRGTLTQNELTSKYGVHNTQVSTWKKQLLDAVPDIFSDKRRGKDIAQETLVDELYKQIGQLTVERDWLKKKSELFSG